MMCFCRADRAYSRPGFADGAESFAFSKAKGSAPFLPDVLRLSSEQQFFGVLRKDQTVFLRSEAEGEHKFKLLRRGRPRAVGAEKNSVRAVCGNYLFCGFRIDSFAGDKRGVEIQFFPSAEVCQDIVPKPVPAEMCGNDDQVFVPVEDLCQSLRRNGDPVRGDEVTPSGESM